jgi:hypothetical protein
MRPDTDYRPAAYVVVALGTALAFVAATVPFYDAGYRLDLVVLLVGLAPYVVYGILTEFVRGRWLLAAGMLLFAFDLALRISERFLRYDGYTDGLVYIAPLVATGVLALALGLAVRAHKATVSPSAPEKP